MSVLYATLGSSQNVTKLVMVDYTKDNYTFQYPSSWRIDDSKTLGADVFAFSPLSDTLDSFSENVNLIIQEIGQQKITLAQYKEISEKQIIDMLSDGKILSSSIQKKGNEEYYTLTYSMSKDKYRIKMSAICRIKRGKAYLFTFSAEADKYEEYKTIAEKILDSFTVKQ